MCVSLSFKGSYFKLEIRLHHLLLKLIKMRRVKVFTGKIQGHGAMTLALPRDAQRGRPYTFRLGPSNSIPVTVPENWSLGEKVTWMQLESERPPLLSAVAPREPPGNP